MIEHESGTGLRNLNFFIGVVEDNNDPRKEGRVRVRAFGIHGTNAQIQTQDLPWATLIVPNVNFVPPPLNAWVFGFFIDGRDAQQPMVLGIIPTQMLNQVNPSQDGYGAIATENHNLLAKGHRPQDFGEPLLSRNARGENAHLTHALPMEVTKVKDVKMAGSESTWSEPGSAFQPEYPFNHVYETASGHSIEVDDTPGAERILVYHKNGSYIQIDSAGTTTHKSTGDKYDINEGNHHVYIGNSSGASRSTVTIMGDSHVYVDGNKTEEIRGDYIQLIHGNHEVQVAGQMNFNASDEAQLRGAKLTLESNVEHFSIKAGKQIKLTSAGSLHLKSESIFIESTGESNFKASGGLKVEGSNLSMKGSTIVLDSGGSLSVKGSTVYIDDVVRMAEGGSSSAPSAGSAEEAVAADLSEPTFKSPNTSGGQNTASGGAVSYASQDDFDSSSSGSSGGSGGGGAGSGGGDNVGIAPTEAGFVQPISNPVAVRELYQYMIEEGLTQTQAIGALVNVQRESGFNAGAVGDNGNSFGLFQFNLPGGRGRPFLNAVPDWQSNPRGQINFMFKQDPLGKQYAARSFSSNLEAANWFTNRVEIPLNKASYTGPGGYNETNIGQIEKLVGGSQTVVQQGGIETGGTPI